MTQNEHWLRRQRALLNRHIDEIGQHRAQEQAQLEALKAEHQLAAKQHGSDDNRLPLLMAQMEAYEQLCDYWTQQGRALLHRQQQEQHRLAQQIKLERVRLN